MSKLTDWLACKVLLVTGGVIAGIFGVLVYQNTQSRRQGAIEACIMREKMHLLRQASGRDMPAWILNDMHDKYLPMWTENCTREVQESH